VVRRLKPLWTCPDCGRSFANRNQTHACGVQSLDVHLKGKSDAVVATYERLIEAAKRNGPLEVIPEKTRIALATRMSFAALQPKRNWVDGHVVLTRRLESPRFRKIETMGRHSHVHHFRLSAPEQVDDEVAQWLAEAYEKGLQGGPATAVAPLETRQDFPI
jgi:Domain of unknown function (DUF5655)